MARLLARARLSSVDRVLDPDRKSSLVSRVGSANTKPPRQALNLRDVYG